MKRLFLLRHAESGWDDPGQDDFDRSLTQRGRRSALLIGQHMKHLGYAPSIALCSPARRAQETWNLVQSALASEAAEEMHPALYLPDPRTMLDTIRKIGNVHPSAIVISHNPGTLALALGLSGNDVQSANPFGKYPTAALTVFDFALEAWADMRPGEGDLISFTHPKELDSAA